MSTQTIEATASETKPGLARRAFNKTKAGVHRARYGLGVGLVGAGLAVSNGASAFAAAGDPVDVDQQVTDGFDSVKTLLTNVVAPALFAIAVLIIGVVVGIKWLRKGAKQG